MNAGAQLPLEVPLPSARLERAARHARWAASMRQVVGDRAARWRARARPLLPSRPSAAAAPATGLLLLGTCAPQ